MTRIAAIVLNFERPHLTIKCLESLLRQSTEADLVIYCVDNGSSRDCRNTVLAWLQNQGSRCELDRARFIWLQLSTNRGYSGGVNAALRLILEHESAGYIWVLNNDTIAETSAAKELLETSRQCQDHALVGATIVGAATPPSPDGTTGTLQCAGGCRFYPWTTITKPNHAGANIAQVNDLPELEMNFVFGASLFAPAQLFQGVGLFDESRFFLYCEELDFAARARDRGYGLAWSRKSQLRHIGGATTHSRSSRHPQGSPQAFYFENLSTLRYLAKHHKLALVPGALFRLAFKLATAVTLQRWTEFRQVLRAYGHFLSGAGWQAGPLDEPDMICFEG